ncbi:MAG: hypothetical protein VXW32_10340, partial [Myxococcota bacterium]|nr:hypothetical protein [Myxococcota bacterium]
MRQFALFGLSCLLVVGCSSDSTDREEGSVLSDCVDGADNDSDGLVDCDDDGCAGTSECEGDTGDTSNGDSGDPTDTDDTGEEIPVVVEWLAVGAGGDHSCGIDLSGSVVCWGSNESEQARPPAGKFTQLSVGGDHNCAINDANEVRCWGFNYYGQATPPSGTFSTIDA